MCDEASPTVFARLRWLVVLENTMVNFMSYYEVLLGHVFGYSGPCPCSATFDTLQKILSHCPALLLQKGDL